MQVCVADMVKIMRDLSGRPLPEPGDEDTYEVGGIVRNSMGRTKYWVPCVVGRLEEIGYSVEDGCVPAEDFAEIRKAVDIPGLDGKKSGI